MGRGLGLGPGSSWGGGGGSLMFMVVKHNNPTGCCRTINMLKHNWYWEHTPQRQVWNLRACLVVRDMAKKQEESPQVPYERTIHTR